MSQKNLETIVPPAPPHFVGDGFRVHGFIPGSPPLSMERMNPFLMFDYNSKFYFPPSDTPRGVGVHPHRGFETVTIAYKGKVAHHDSSGGGGVIGEGDVQWMTAASGILHKEFHEENFSKEGGDFQMVQLWVNLPAKDKMSAPKYQDIKNADMPKIRLDDADNSDGDGSFVEVIAGSYQDAMGAASTFTPVTILNARMRKGDNAAFRFAAAHNTALLVVEGQVKVNGADTVPTDHFGLFENTGENFTITAEDDAVVLVLSGQPIDEPIAAHGPFVMNSRAELVQAFEDYNNGKFGYLT